LRNLEIITTSDEEMHVIRHDDIPSNGETKLVPTSANVAFECAVSCAQVSNLLSMNCANGYEVQWLIVGLKDLFKSRRTSLDLDAILAADTVASTPTPTSKRVERLPDF
jgi:hypothetical protein